METFNYPLTVGDIFTNFQIVANVDSDLNGIPDLLEDICLGGSTRPFLGAPVVITGTVEAEQFDAGSNGYGYFSTNNHPSTAYRPTGMFITNCNDLGGGYCLDKTQAGDWTAYTIYVVEPQTYLIEARVESVSTNTGGVFQFDFTNAAAAYASSTGPMTNFTTSWTNVSKVVYLPAGVTTMKLRCMTNDAGGYVGRFNYISIYPYWVHTGPPPTNSTNTFIVSGLSAGTNFYDGVSNAAAIQQAIDDLPSTGGTVIIPGGTWYVSQPAPDETQVAAYNAALSVMVNNIEISGEPGSNTTLIADNRANTILCLGRRYTGGSFFYTVCTNFTLCNLTLEAQPHSVAFTNPTFGFTNSFEAGQLAASSDAAGTPLVLYGNSSQYSVDICVSNCTFLHGVKSIAPFYSISNLLVCNSQFTQFDTNCWFNHTTNSSPTNTSNTVAWQSDIGIFANVVYNVVITNNSYNGNSALTQVSATNYAPDGFVYFQSSSGNVYVGWNFITNNQLEAIQVGAGPNAVVGNSIGTLLRDNSSCALNAYDAGQGGLTGTNAIGYSTCFVGNLVCGEWHGELGGAYGEQGFPYSLTFSGNLLSLSNSTTDFPSACVKTDYGQTLNICGNTLVSGGFGLSYGLSNGSALILNNNFAKAAYCAIGGNNIPSLNAAQIFGNALGQGATFHIQLQESSSFGWFVGKNTYNDASLSSNSLFLDPLSSSIHLSH